MVVYPSVLVAFKPQGSITLSVHQALEETLSRVQESGSRQDRSPSLRAVTVGTQFDRIAGLHWRPGGLRFAALETTVWAS